MNIDIDFAEAIKSVVEAVKSVLQEMAKVFSELVQSLTKNTVYEFEYGKSYGTVTETNIIAQGADVANDIIQRPTHTAIAEPPQRSGVMNRKI